MSTSTCDVIVVLGNRLKRDGSLGKTARARVEKGVELLQSGLAPILALSGGAGYSGPRTGITEATQMKRYAMALGVPKSAIVLENKSRDTIGNAYYTRDLVKLHGWHSLALVTSESQMERAMFIFRRLVDAVYIRPVPVPIVLASDEMDAVLHTEQRGFTLARIILSANLAPAWCWIIGKL